MEAIDVVLVRILSMDALTSSETESPTPNFDRLFGLADEVNLNAAVVGIVLGQMIELANVEVSVKFAVGPLEEIEIECSSDSGFIIIGGSAGARPSSDRHR
jgi:hypothetical protein